MGNLEIISIGAYEVSQEEQGRGKTKNRAIRVQVFQWQQMKKNQGRKLGRTGQKSKRRKKSCLVGRQGKKESQEHGNVFCCQLVKWEEA